jgi:hypothetical protein
MTFFSSLTTLGRDVPGGGNSLQALELPSAVSPALAGVVVGAVAGVAVFLTIFLLLTRRKPTRGMASATQVVFIPPYATNATNVARTSSVPPAHPSSFPPPSGQLPAATPNVAQSQHAGSFVPASSLSARAFAKMGYAFGDRLPGAVNDPFDAIEERMMAENAEVLSDDDLVDEEPSGVKPIEAGPAPTVVLTGAPRKPDSTPHPLGIIRSDSAVAKAMTPPSGVSRVSAIPVAPVVAAFRPSIPEPEPTQIGLGLAPDPIDPPSAPSIDPPSASGAHPRSVSIEALDYDDAPTEFCEPYFDEPLQPRTRGSRPKIRKMSAAPPRFPTPSPRPAAKSFSSLPAIAPPPRGASLKRSS